VEDSQIGSLDSLGQVEPRDSDFVSKSSENESMKEVMLYLRRSAEIARRILSAFGVSTQEKTLKLLGVDSEKLGELNEMFPEMMRKRIASHKPEDKIDALFLYETLKTRGVMAS
jgi:hypothetical protein